MTATVSAPTRYGGFWVRVVAFILDGIIIGVIGGALAPIFGVTVVETTTVSGGVGGVTVNYSSSALGSLLGLIYFVGFWSLRGQTPGMIPFGMRIVRASDGTRPDWVVSLLRYVGLIISFVVIFIGVIWVTFDSRKQGWMDKIAGTLVVRD